MLSDSYTEVALTRSDYEELLTLQDQVCESVNLSVSVSVISALLSIVSHLVAFCLSVYLSVCTCSWRWNEQAMRDCCGWQRRESAPMKARPSSYTAKFNGTHFVCYLRFDQSVSSRGVLRSFPELAIGVLLPYLFVWCNFLCVQVDATCR